MPEPKRQPAAKSKNDLRREHMEKQRAVKKRRRILAYCVILFVVLIVFAILAFTVFFRISDFNISGKTKYSTEEIVTASGLEIGDPLYLFSADKAEEKIESALPMIESAEISRKISGKITVTVKAATPVYAIAYGEKYALLSKEGKILSVSGKADTKGKTLIVTGAALKNATPGDLKLSFSDETEDKRETAETLESVITGIKNSELKDITEINIKNKSNITIQYQNRITLKFGTSANFEEKTKLAVKSLENENNISFDQKGTLDLRVYGEAVFTPAEE